MEPIDTTQTVIVHELYAPDTIKKGTIIEEVNVTPSTSNAFLAYSGRKIGSIFKPVETSDTIEHLVTTGEELTYTRQSSYTDDDDHAFQSATVDHEWLFLLLFNHTLVAYKAQTEMWRFDFASRTRCIVTANTKIVSASQYRIILSNSLGISILTNRNFVRYDVHILDTIASVITLHEDSFIILRVNTLIERCLLSIISNNGEELCSQYISPTQSISSFNGGILALCKPADEYVYYLKWYKKIQEQLHHGLQYRTHYTACVSSEEPKPTYFRCDKTPRISAHNDTVIVTYDGIGTVFNNRLERIVKFHCGKFQQSLMCNGNPIVYYHVDDMWNQRLRGWGIRFTTIPTSPSKSMVRANVTLYDAILEKSHLIYSFEYMDSIVAMVGYHRLCTVVTRWSKRNNFLQSKKNRDAIKTLYAIQHCGAFHTPKDVLDLIVTFAFSTI